MPPMDSELDENRDVDALARVVRDGVLERSPSELDHGLRRLTARLHADGRRRAARLWLVGAFAACGALVAVGVHYLGRRSVEVRESTTLGYRIEGGSVLDGGYLRESGHAGIDVSFDEGSHMALTSGTRGRLRSIDRKGARVAIDQGTASFEVVQGGGRRWSVEAGPFLVSVKGTIFTVAWDASSERFELSLHRGQVLVSGPVPGGDVTLRDQQRLVVNLQKAETVITDEQLESPPGGEAAGNESVGVPQTAPTAPARPTGSKGRSGGLSVAPSVAAPSAPSLASSPAAGKGEGSGGRWADELAHGHWDRILDAVEREGQASALDRASSEDLIALANVARYRHRIDLARAALLTQRRRFPGSPRADDALFLLGRVEELEASGSSRALGWYDAYLQRKPAGAFAAEALGRKMTLTRETLGAQAARSMAEEYLRRFPRGSYAGSARALRDAP